MSSERMLTITRPENFDECNSCEILQEELDEAKQTTTHKRTLLPLEVEDIHIICREMGHRSTRSKKKHVNFVPSIHMEVRVDGTITNPGNSQAKGFNTKEFGVGCPRYSFQKK